MKRLYLLLSLMTALLLSPADVLAWGGVALHGNFTGSWTDVYNNQSTGSFSSNVAFDVDASSWSAGTYEFGIRLYWDTPSAGNDWFGGNGASITLNTSVSLGTSGNCKMTHSTTYKSYHFEITNATGTGLTLKVTGSTVAPDTSGDSYYFYSEELLAGLGMSTSQWKSDVFKFSPLRWRTKEVDASLQGKYDNDYQTWSMKDDLMKKANVSNIKYQIRKGDGTVIYKPWNDTNYELGSSTTTEDNGGVRVQTYENTSGAASSSAWFTLRKGTAQSYNFCICTTGTRPVTLQLNGDLSRIDDNHQSNNKEYYLIGNLKNANAGEAWNPTDASYRWKMDRHIYKDGKVVTSEAGCDSVVYSVTVNRPDTGWGYLYLAVCPAFLVDDNDFNDWDWGHILRPQIIYNKRKDHDGTATEGCLSYYDSNDNTYDGGSFNDAINPVVSNDIESYTFTMNYTYSTYRLVFNRKFYIVGPAVNGTTDNWEEGAIEFPYNATKGCWETTVTMYNGKPFRFAMDKKMTNCFGENNAKPAAPNTTGWAIDNGDWETQYCNKLQWYNEGTEAHNSGMSDNDITFNLPTGSYNIKFWATSGNDGNPSEDQSRVYYTIDPEYTFKAPGSSSVQNILNPLESGYTYYRTFYYIHSLKLPNGVKAYKITEVVDDHISSAKAVKSLVVGDVLYGNTPVILALDGTGRTGTMASVKFEFADDPFLQAVDDATNTNMLRGSLNSEHLEKQAVDGSYNYIFGYKRLKADDAGVTLGFWHPGTGNTAFCSSYLNYSADVTYPANGLVIDFDDVVGTGINATEVETAESKEYYNMQGMRVVPTQKGIYIHNGKKVIIK